MTRRLPGARFLPAGAAPAAAYLAILLVVPLVVLVTYSFWKADFLSVTRTFTLENYTRFFSNDLYISILVKTLLTSFCVSSVIVFIAYQVAYAIVFRFKVWGPRILVLIMATLLSSYIVRLFSLTTILGTNGILNMALMGLGITDEPLTYLLYGYPAIIITLVYVYLPIAVLPIFAGLQGVDRTLHEASRDLGVGSIGTFTRVTLPLSMRGVRTAFAFCFILSAADYVAPQMVGGVDGQMIGAVIANQFGGGSNYPFGAMLSIMMICGFGVVLGFCLLVEKLVVRISRCHFWARMNGAKRVRVPDVPLTETTTLLALVFLFTPLLTVFVFSFNDTPNPGLPFGGITLHWYADVLTDAQFHRVLLTSLRVAGIALLGVMVLAVPVALVLVRRRFLLKKPLNMLIFAPMAVPGVVIGVALLATFVTLNVPLGTETAAAAHIMLVIPFVVQVVRTRFESVDANIEEAAHDLGSSSFRTLRTVTLPILLPAILGAGILAAAISLDELLVTNFIIGRDATIPVWIVSQLRTGLSPALNVVAILMLVGTLVLIGLAGLLLNGRKRARQRATTEGIDV